jgi:formate dehydrogenase major subunit
VTTLEDPGTSVRTITAEIDGRQVTVPDGTSIYDAARQIGVDIPVLCHNERYDPVGVCRMCVVDTGGRAFAAACVRPCEDGMTVRTDTPELNRSRATLTELLIADQPPRAEDPKQNTTGDNLLLELADRFDVARETTELPCASGRGSDSSNPVIDVNHDACILCDRCVRACDDIQGNDVIGRSGKGYTTRIAFDLDDPMGNSSCVTCGECVQACPTGALTNKPINLIPIQPRERLDAVDSVCPYCGVGCALTYYVDRERNAISFAEGRPQPGSQSRLCVKGRYGWDYAASPQRLTVPLIRIDSSYPKGALSADVRGDMDNDRGRAGAGGDRSGGGRSAKKGRDGRRKPGGLVDYDEVLPHFREATWEEALDLVARRLLEVHAAGGPGAIAGFGSGNCTNEEAYLFQKHNQQRRPLHPALPRLLGRRAVRGRRLRCRLDHVRGRGQRRGRHHHRLQPDGEPSRGELVLQAGPPPRHEDHLRRPAGEHGRRARRLLLPGQAGH